MVQNRIDVAQHGDNDDSDSLLDVVNALTKRLMLDNDITERVNGLRRQVEQVKNTTDLLLESLGQIKDRIRDDSHAKEFYTPAEVAEMLGKATFTVREWCRLQRIHARKRETGRGDAEEWEISRSEVERYRNHGLLPRPTKY